MRVLYLEALWKGMGASIQEHCVGDPVAVVASQTEAPQKNDRRDSVDLQGAEMQVIVAELTESVRVVREEGHHDQCNSNEVALFRNGALPYAGDLESGVVDSEEAQCFSKEVVASVTAPTGAEAAE